MFKKDFPNTFFSSLVISYLRSKNHLNIMIRACIFDLDGVIVDTAKYHFIAWRRLANELGFDFDESFNEKLKGVSRMKSLELILEQGGVSLSEEEQQTWATKKNEWYQEFIKKMTPAEILPGIPEFLAQLKSGKIGVGLGSASKNAVPILKQIQLLDAFDIIIDGTKTTKGKPDPQVFQMGAAGLEVAPNECIVFEDAAKGIEAALSGGFWAVGIGSEESLGKAHHVMKGFENMSYEGLLQVLNLS